MKFTAKFLHKIYPDSLIRYAQGLVADGVVKAVYLVGSTVGKGVGNDIDLLYDFGNLGLPSDEGAATEMLEQIIESTNIDSEKYDSFYKADGRYFHLSMGAGRSIIENNEYAQYQAEKPIVRLA